MTRLLLGFDIGGTKSAAVLGREEGDRIEILGRRGFPTEGGPGAVLAKLEESAAELQRKHGNVEAVGISCGGPLDSRRGVILRPPNLPGWVNVAIVRRFEKALGRPTKLLNDANACALAEWKWGAGRGTRNMIFLTFGTGMGAGLILDGRLYAGTNDLAGEVGHIRLAEDGPVGFGKAGSFEGFCSGGGIERAAGKDAKTVFEEAQKGDPQAREVVERVARRLGQGLSVLIDAFNPEMIVLGGIFMRRHELLRPGMERAVAEEAIPESAAVCRVVPAGLGEALGDCASLGVSSQ
ncbi:MAG: ROK family protein [Planctomycetota bacterium]